MAGEGGLIMQTKRIALDAGCCFTAPSVPAQSPSDHPQLLNATIVSCRNAIWQRPDVIRSCPPAFVHCRTADGLPLTDRGIHSSVRWVHFWFSTLREILYGRVAILVIWGSGRFAVSSIFTGPCSLGDRNCVQKSVSK